MAIQEPGKATERQVGAQVVGFERTALESQRVDTDELPGHVYTCARTSCAPIVFESALLSIYLEAMRQRTDPLFRNEGARTKSLLLCLIRAQVFRFCG